MQELLQHGVGDIAFFTRQRVWIANLAQRRVSIGFDLIDLLRNEIKQGVPESCQVH